MRAFLLVLVSFAFVAVSAAPKNLPSQWPICKKNDPNLETCLTKAVTAAVNDLSDKGAKEFGVFPIDPLIISQLDIDQGSGPVSIELHFKNLHISGFKGVKLGDVKADVDNYKFQAPMSFPNGIVLEGDYKIKGKVLVLPINGEGKCALRLENPTALLDLIGKEMKKDGHTYMNVTDFKFTFEPKKLVMNFENLFNGDKRLSDHMNTFLNENWSEILKELKPSIMEAFGSAFREISNRIFNKVQYSKVFPSA